MLLSSVVDRKTSLKCHTCSVSVPVPTASFQERILQYLPSLLIRLQRLRVMTAPRRVPQAVQPRLMSLLLRYVHHVSETVLTWLESRTTCPR
jgi:hypothetical protein